MAGGLERELIAKYGVRPTMRHQYHELEVLVDGKSVFCYTRAHRIPTVASLLATVEKAASSELAPEDLARKA